MELEPGSRTSIGDRMFGVADVVSIEKLPVHANGPAAYSTSV